MRRYFLILAVVGLALAARPHEASAHPLGNFTVNRCIRVEVYRDVVRLTYVLDFAEIPSFQELASIDTNGDGPSPDELAAWAERLFPGLPAQLAVTLRGEA